MARMLRRLAVLGLLATVAGASLLAQRGLSQRGGFFGLSSQSAFDNPPYDGRFVFVRMSYPTGMGFGRRGDTPWAHDYPVGEAHFLKILSSVSNVPVNLERTSVLGFDDPEMFKFPVLYLVEPGFWRMTDEEVVALRSYLTKGGFLIVDDFPYWAWEQFEAEMGRVFPQGEWRELDVSHPIFHSFFDIATLDIVPAYPALGDRPIFRAMFQDNDPSKRMYVIANYQNDLSEFWEFSEEGRYLLSESNEAYKVGVNQFIYGLTH